MSNNIIQVFSGQGVDPFKATEVDIDIGDIAVALSHICRYNGHVKHFYSVAQHSVLVSLMVPQEDALWGLLHDATEAYLTDFPRPLKSAFPEYKVAEDRLMKVVARRFGMPEEMPDSVKAADVSICILEKEALLNPSGIHWSFLDGVARPDMQPITPWSPTAARQFFEQRFRQLTEDRSRRGNVTVQTKPAIPKKERPAAKEKAAETPAE